MTSPMTNRGLRPLLACLAMMILGACASTPFDRERYDDALTPAQLSRADGPAQDREVLWGGLIVAARNLEHTSELEILAYPLDSRQRPDASRPPQGRFLAVVEGYLETGDYAEGRMATVGGPLGANREGKIGESRYTYPVIETTPDLIHLWPAGRSEAEPRLNFGIGVMLGR